MQLASAHIVAWKSWSEDQTKHNVEQTESAFSLASSNLASWKSWTEGQTQCLQQEVAMNRETIDEQSKELTEMGQQLITARPEKRKKQWLRATTIARACGGSRQDVGTKGAIPALMNTYSILFRIS